MSWRGGVHRLPKPVRKKKKNIFAELRLRMHQRETLFPQPVLTNAALYALVALVYSIAFFIIDQTNPGAHVFAKNAQVRQLFSLLSICSWPILLFGALTLVAVRVGGNVRRRRRRRRRRGSRSSKSVSRSRSRSMTPNGRRCSSAPPSLQRPPSTAVPSVVTGPVEAPPAAVGGQQSFANSRTSGEKGSKKGVSVDLGSVKVESRGEKMRTSTPGASRTTSKRSGKSSSSHVPRGFVSVTRGQKAFSAIGFFLVTIGLLATAVAAALICYGQRQRNLLRLKDLGYEQDGVKEWAIALATGGVFTILFAVLSVSVAINFIKAISRTPYNLELRTVSLGHDDELDALEGAWIRTNSRPGDDFTGLAIVPDSPTPTVDGEESICEDGSNKTKAKSGIADSVSVTPGNANEVAINMHRNSCNTMKATILTTPASQGDDWRDVYRRGAFLPYQPDEGTVERMMRQLRDMGFNNPFQNIAALQASSFDLEIASDKLTNAQMDNSQRVRLQT